jgi:hypothetical protein
MVNTKLPKLTKFDVDEWFRNRFGWAEGKAGVGHPFMHTTFYGRAIKGFWRGGEGLLRDIKLVLVGKMPNVHFGGHHTNQEFNKAFRDNNGKYSTKDSHFARCPAS